MLKSIDPEVAQAEADRGRLAQHPREIPRRGWSDVAWRVKEQLDADNVSIVAGGLALFGMLSVFPSLAAAVAIYGLVASPDSIGMQIGAFRGLLPPATLQIIQSQLAELVSRGNGALSFSAAFSVILALWSARRGMVALITAMNVAYNEYDRRRFLGRLGLALTFALSAVAGLVLAVALGAVLPIVIHFLPLGAATEALVLAARWVLLWLVAVGALSALYRYAPHRRHARWSWVNYGAVVAATLWLLGSVLFALYVRNFDSFGKTYGAIGSVVVMLMWFYVSAFIVILGAEINSELERQTLRDSTVGDELPIGERGARSADTVGASTHFTPSALFREVGSRIRGLRLKR